MAKNEASIIEVIDKMVREGESEEKIIKTLKDLGVEPEKAKRLQTRFFRGARGSR